MATEDVTGFTSTGHRTAQKRRFQDQDVDPEKYQTRGGLRKSHERFSTVKQNGKGQQNFSVNDLDQYSDRIPYEKYGNLSTRLSGELADDRRLSSQLVPDYKCSSGQLALGQGLSGQLAKANGDGGRNAEKVNAVARDLVQAEKKDGLPSSSALVLRSKSNKERMRGLSEERTFRRDLRENEESDDSHYRRVASRYSDRDSFQSRRYSPYPSEPVTRTSDMLDYVLRSTVDMAVLYGQLVATERFNQDAPTGPRAMTRSSPPRRGRRHTRNCNRKDRVNQKFRAVTKEKLDADLDKWTEDALGEGGSGLQHQ